MGIESEIQNYYEHLVSDQVYSLLNDGKIQEEDVDDIACVALNNLPAKYYRHSVDMAFYLAAEELRDMKSKVQSEVESAVEFVKKHRAR